MPQPREIQTHHIARPELWVSELFCELKIGESNVVLGVNEDVAQIYVVVDIAVLVY